MRERRHDAATQGVAHINVAETGSAKLKNCGWRRMARSVISAAA
jgi:hypothetical protein